MPDSTIKVSDLTTTAELNLYYVLWVDVVDYSPMPLTKSIIVVNELDAALKKCPTYQVAKSKDELIEIPSGDGWGLVFKHDAASPARCALELKEEVSRLGTFRVRMGIHIGPAETRAENIAGRVDVHGDALNIAARVLGIANPGEILVSSQAYEILRHSESFLGLFEDAGTHTVKHGVEIQAYRLISRMRKTKTYFRATPRDRELASRLYKNNVEAELPVASVSEIAERLSVIRRDAFLGVFLMAIALFFSLPLENSRIGHDTKQWAYERLQSNLSGPTEQVPVVVVDIGRNLDKDDAGTTDLLQLKGVLDEIEQLEPAAVAIDIDFGYLPFAKRWLDDNETVVSAAYDYTFKEKKPVYLAVKRSLYRQDPQQWLGDEKYKDLVVHPLFSESEVGLGPTTLAKSIKLGSNEIPSVVDRLVAAYRDSSGRKDSGRINAPLSTFVTPYEETTVTHADLPFGSSGTESSLTSGEILQEKFFLNFSALDTLKRQTIVARDRRDVLADPRKSERIRGAMVIIGSVDSERDSWIRPDTHTKEAGIYLHAVGAYTHAIAPVYEFRSWARIALNCLSLLLVLGSVLFVRYRTVTSVAKVQGGVLSVIFTLATALLTFVFGVWLVRTYEIFWTDFMMTSLLVLFHPRFEHEIVKVWGLLRVFLKRTWTALVFSQQKSNG